MSDNIAIWGEAAEPVRAQIERCAADPRVAGAALMADNHLGYSQPIGGVVAYRGAVSPSGVGYDIGCGNKAVRASGLIWIGVHFGSRGFGNQVASGFLNLAAGRQFGDRAPGNAMDEPPTVIEMNTALGETYFAAMELAGAYAYAGRDLVTAKVLEILGAEADFQVHNHHNYAWRERHGGEELYVVRKGATPCWPGQLGFVGGSMGDIGVIIRGRDNEEAARSLYSTVHGAGRVMSRTQAAGKVRRVRQPGGGVRWERTGGRIDEAEMRAEMRRRGIELRGAGADEAPDVYRKLQTVLDAHAGYVDVLHTLEPVAVVMAGADEYDPYKD